MTTGHPDFQDYVTWRSGNMMPARVTTYPPGLTQGNAMPVYNFAAVLFRISPQTGYGNVTLQWWLDEAMTMHLSTDNWPVTPYQALLVVMPAEAAYVSVLVDNTSGANATFETYLAGTNVGDIRPAYPITQDLAAGVAVTLPASTATKYYQAYINRGTGHLHISPSDNTGSVWFYVITENEAGVQQSELLALPNVTAITDVTFPRPDTIVALTASNIDSSHSHTFNYSLWCSDA
jgi:hypothetical protein